MSKRLLLLSVLVLFAACGKQDAPGESRLVMEGWIESGGHPVVILSESVAVEDNKDIDPKTLIDHLAKWAKVTVSDGDKEVILSGVADNNYFPPYIFTSARITGEVGKTYSIKVEYKDYVATAVTTIPQPVPVDSLYVKEVSADSLCTVMCCFTDPPQPGNYYKVFTKTTGKDMHYHPSAFTSLSDDKLDGHTELMVYSTQRLLDYIDKPNLKLGEELWLKLYTMEEPAYRFWNNFEMTIASNVANTFYQNDLRTNVQGALGYWNGYGVAGEYKIQLEYPEQTENTE